MSAKKVTLLELKVADLKHELEERECDITGKKRALQDRLREQLEIEVMENLKGELVGKIQQKLTENSSNLEQKLLENSNNLEQKLLENVNNLKSEIMEHSKYVDEKFKSMEQEILENSDKLETKILQMREEIENKLTALNVRQGDDNQSQVNAEHSERHSETEARLRMKPPQFDGKTAWANYILQFEAAARANMWTTAEKATALTLALRGDATDILQTLSEVEQRDISSLYEN